MYLFDELYKWDYSTPKAWPQLESKFHKFTKRPTTIPRLPLPFIWRERWENRLKHRQRKYMETEEDLYLYDIWPYITITCLYSGEQFCLLFSFLMLFL